MDTPHIAGAVLATVTALLLGACRDDSAPSTSEQSPRASESSSAATSSARPSITEDTSDYSILGPTSRASLDAGRWAVTASGSRDVPLAVLDLPEGLNGGGGYVWSPPEDGGWILGYWNPSQTGVHLDPCTRMDTFDASASKIPDSWPEALGAQRRTTTSDPVPVRLGGYGGLYLELTGPKNLDLDTCRAGRLTIFETTKKGDHHWIAEPGVVERFWILDVDGERVVLTAAATPETTDSQVEQLEQVVESVQFVRS